MSRRLAVGSDRDDYLPIDPDIDTVEDLQHRRHRGASTPDRRRPERRPLPRPHPVVLAIIFAGGVVGGLARYAITSAWSTPTADFPWATFMVNTAGAFALALLLVLLAQVLAPNRYLRPLLGTGMLGAFTTFSSVMTSSDQLAAQGHLRTAAAYLGASVLVGLGAASLGILLGRAVAAWLHPRRPPPTEGAPRVGLAGGKRDR